MSRDSNAELLKKTYKALIDGDRDTLEQIVSPDAHFHVPGRSIVAGEYSSIDAALSLFRRIVTLTEATYKRELIDVLAGESHAAAMIHVTARHGGRLLNLIVVFAVMIEDGKVTEMRSFNSDQASWDAFWSDEMLTATPLPEFRPPRNPIDP